MEEIIDKILQFGNKKTETFNGISILEIEARI